MTRLPQLEDALIKAAQRLEARQRPITTARRSARVVGIALAAALVLGGMALAATQILKTGKPVPADLRSAGFFGVIKPGTTRLLAVRVADPAGGPPWGLRAYRTTIGRGARSLALNCFQVGRVVNGRLGVIGQDGSFNNDGSFHELPVQANSCGGLDARGQDFSYAQFSSIASADQRLSCETPAERQARLVDVPRALRASLRRKQRAGDAQAIRLERRLVARQARLAAHNTPLCPASDLRTVVYGTLGPLSNLVTAVDATTRQSQRPDTAQGGAYLFVLPGRTDQHRDLKVQATYPAGLVCTQGAPRDPRRCSPPPGFVSR